LYVTHFNVGDEDIVSLNGNGAFMDPVIGRIRILDDDVFTASGHRLIKDRHNALHVSAEKANHRTIKVIEIDDIEYPSINNLPEETADVDSIGAACEKARSTDCKSIDAGEIKKILKQKCKDILKFSRKVEESANPDKHRKFFRPKD